MLKSLLVLLTAFSASSTFAAPAMWPDDKALPAHLGKDDSGPAYLRLVLTESIIVPTETIGNGPVYMSKGKFIGDKEFGAAKDKSETVCWLVSRLKGEEAFPSKMEVGDVWYNASASFGGGKLDVEASSTATLKISGEGVDVIGYIHVQTNFKGIVPAGGIDKHMEVTLGKLRECLGRNAILEVIDRK